MIKTISNKNINAKAISNGDSFMLGSALIEILAPMKQDKNINNIPKINNMMDPPITKPAMNNRMKKLLQLAKEAAK